MPTIAEGVRGLVGLARRANKLAVGFEACARNAAKKRAALILLAEDLSPATATRFRRKLSGVAVPILAHGRKAEWGSLLGREAVGVLAVLDKGLGHAIAGKVASVSADRNRSR